MGMLPLTYLCWTGYSLTIVAKIFILIWLEIPARMVQDNNDYCEPIIKVN